MNEDIAASLTKILEWAEAGETFVVEQAPLVVQEMIAWGVMRGSLGIALGVFLMVAGLLIAFLIERRGDQPDRILHLMSALPGLMGFFIAVSSIGNLMKVLTAPRLYVIDQLGRYL